MDDRWRKVELTDHEFAKYLRKEKAIDNYFHEGNHVQWRNNMGVCVAEAIYYGMNRDIYLPPEPEMKEQTTMVLVDKKTGSRLWKGNRVTTFRGEPGILEAMTPPHKPSSSGRVYVKIEDTTNEFFPGVINAEWRMA